MNTLGIVLAGGLSTRFGSDKALAPLDGRPLIEHALLTLGRYAVIVGVAGRDHPGALSIADRPARGLGPLGGLAGALHFAADNGFAQVLTCGVDSVDLPEDLFDLLSPAPAILAAQPVIGLWPASAAAALDAFLADDPRRSVRGFAASIGARAIETAHAPANINTPQDLTRLELTHGL